MRTFGCAHPVEAGRVSRQSRYAPAEQCFGSRSCQNRPGGRHSSRCSQVEAPHMRHYFSHDLRGDDLSKGQSPGAARRCVWLASCRFPSREPRARRRHRRHHSRGDQPPKTFCAIENDCNRMRNFRPRSQSQCMRSKSWNVKSSPTCTDGRSCSAVSTLVPINQLTHLQGACSHAPSLPHSPTHPHPPHSS